jgi:hypothetical protein
LNSVGAFVFIPALLVHCPYENRAYMMAFLDNVSAPDCIAVGMSSRPKERPPVYDPSLYPNTCLVVKNNS